MLNLPQNPKWDIARVSSRFLFCDEDFFWVSFFRLILNIKKKQQNISQLKKQGLSLHK